jgi:predicted RNA polymerase sigma factor
VTGGSPSLATVLQVLHLVFNEGYTGNVDLATEAIRLTRQLASMTDDPDDTETAGLLALMLLHHARRPARTLRDGSLVPLTEQDRSRWNTSLITEGVAVLQTALGRDRVGEFQLNRAIAIGEADGPGAGLAALATVDPGLPRHTAASAYLHEKAGDIVTAARLYADAARSAPNLAERHHLTRQAADQSSAARVNLFVNPS